MNREKLMMNNIPYSPALIIGAGPGISASLTRMLAGAGLKASLAARYIDKLKALSPICGQPWRKIIDTPFRGAKPVYGTKIA